jgi:large subunit ribosomal protein L3
MAKGIIGKKLGMTQIFEEDGKFIPVTVVLAGPCTVLQNKTEETDGYNAIQVGFGEKSEKNVTKPMKGHFAKAGIAPAEFVKELRLDAPSDLKVGDVIKADIFAAGEIVDVSGVTRGKGFAGTIKLHNFARGPMKHGSKSHREPGSIGPMRSGPGGRVEAGKKLPCRMGGKNATVQHLTIAKVDAERNLILVHGSIPGANGTCVVIKETSKVVD